MKNIDTLYNNYKEFYYNYEQKFNIEKWYDIRFNNVLYKINEYHNENFIYGNILEIGIFLGLSFLPLSFLIKENELIVGIDTFEDYGNTTETEKKFINNIIDIRKTIERIIIIKNKSENINDKNIKFNFLQYRIVSIDGNHTYENTIYDLNLSKSILHKDGVIIVDDYENKDWPEIKIAVDDFCQKNKEINISKKYLENNKAILFYKTNSFYNNL
jgi:hypothetical protein